MEKTQTRQKAFKNVCKTWALWWCEQEINNSILEPRNRNRKQEPRQILKMEWRD